MTTTTVPDQFVAMGDKLKVWEPKDVPFEPNLVPSMLRIAALPGIEAVALMPDAHIGIGCAVGSVIGSIGVVLPSAVGVDIGCGMCALRTSLKVSDLPDSLASLRGRIEQIIPMGTGGRYTEIPGSSSVFFDRLKEGLERIHSDSEGKIDPRSAQSQLGTLGAGNHFIELNKDQQDYVWIMLHSGSRGIGNRIGTYYIHAAYEELVKQGHNPGKEHAWLSEGSDLFNKYVRAVEWAQNYAKYNREVMLARIIQELNKQKSLPNFTIQGKIISCHHNYISRETHFGKEMIVTRKGAVSAKEGEHCIIPGSMAAQSYIGIGKGSKASMTSASHGAGRVMSRSKAKSTFTLSDHKKATEGVECRRDAGVIDETPGAYKPVAKVMEAQKDLVDIEYTLSPLLCCKG